MFLNLVRQKMFPDDVQFFILRVSVDLNDLHAVQQRLRNRFNRIGRGNKHDAGEIEGRLQIVIPECEILLAVQHLQHGAGRIAAHIHAHLVNLIEQEHRIHGAGLPQ